MGYWTLTAAEMFNFAGVHFQLIILYMCNTSKDGNQDVALVDRVISMCSFGQPVSPSDHPI